MTKKNTKQRLIAVMLACISQPLLADNGPWFTGPLLAPAGHTVPPGQNNLEIYGFHTINEGIYKRHWLFVQTPGNYNNASTILYTRGLAPRVDVKYSIPVTSNFVPGYHDSGVGDISAILGIQVLEQNHHLWRPDLRMTLREVLPSGRYDFLNPNKNGTDSTGFGSYRTSLNFNFQHLLHLYDQHYLRTRLCLTFEHASSVKISGLSSYGGTLATSGRVKPGHEASIDLAGELTLTEHIVAVMEGYATQRGPTTFKGYAGRTASGLPAVISQGSVSDVSLAPAFEYNFNGNVGIIAGVWFSLPGDNSVKFKSTSVALNLFW